jgi:nanoRNase/pAp phosphatase (c-di-AMP/oligoRNAs hydrolase)
MVDEITSDLISSQSSSSREDEVEPPQYAVLGSGGIGFAVAKIFEERGKSLVLVDIDKNKIETLKEQNFNVILGDIADPKTIDKIPKEKLEAVFVLSTSVEANKKAIEYLRVLLPDVQIISRAKDAADKEVLESVGADLVVLPFNLPPKSIASAMVEYLERVTTSRYAQNLLRIIREAADKKLAIVIHDNPDPDAIASAMALKDIAASIGVKSDILFHGVVGHQENKAFVNLLNFDLEPTEELHLEEYGKIALVECAIPGANNLLPHGTKVDIVLDHHQVDLEHVSGEHVDIRPEVGAVATILTLYLKEMGIHLKTEIATALLYGIRIDTNDFKRNTSPVDFIAAAFLHPKADHELIEKIKTPSISTETLDVLGDAIKNRAIYGSYLISNVGIIHNRDALAQAADYLLNLEGITTTIIFGIGEDKIYVSGRSRDIRVNIGKVMKEAFGEENAGGHSALGAAQIPLGVFSGTKDKQTLLKLTDEAIVKRFLSVVGFEPQNFQRS